jgi:ABC-type methionine transport system ATPase subunit
VLLKIHHSAIDVSKRNEITALLHDVSPDSPPPAPPEPWFPENAPGSFGLLWRAGFHAVTLPLRILGASLKKHRDRVRELLAMLSIEKLADRRPLALSGGEMQRVSIARALAAEPPLLLCDEPTGNLSSKHGEEVVRLLESVRKRLGTAILLVTHNPRDAAAADRVLFLHDGAMQQEQSLTGGPFDVADVFRRLEALGI